MIKYMLLIMCFFQSFSLLGINYTVGYQKNKQSDDIATLWKTDSFSSTTQISLGTAESKALSLVQYKKNLFIVGDQNNHATLWIYDLSEKSPLKTITLDTSSDQSSANGIVWTGQDFFAAGYLNDSGSPRAYLWNIDTNGNVISTTQLSQNDSNAFSAAFYQGCLYCPGYEIQNQSNARVFTYDIKNKKKSLINLDINDYTPSVAYALVIDGDQYLNIVGKAVEISDPKNVQSAIVWNYSLTQKTKKFSFLEEDAIAIDIALIGKDLYIVGYLDNASQNGAMWNVGDPEIVSSSSTKYGKFNFITPSKANSLPFYSGGSDSSNNGVYVIFNNFPNSTDYPIPTILSQQATACDMLVDVRMPSNNIPLLLKIHKINSVQKGLNR